MGTRRVSLAGVRLTWALPLLCIVTQGACDGFLGFNWGGGPGEPQQPPNDCLPLGPALRGPPWDTDGDTISTATETNPTNTLAGGGFYSFDTLKWDLNRSIASGQPSSGFLRDGMNLRDQNLGYVHYLGNDNIDTDDWGTGHLLRLIEGSGRTWFTTVPRIQVLDLSLRQGGNWPPHVSHQNGLDVDIRYLRKDARDGIYDTLNICTQGSLYDTLATLRLLETIVVENGDGREGRPFVELVFADTTCLGIANDPRDPFIKHDADHRNHFHVRILDPDGPNN